MSTPVPETQARGGLEMVGLIPGCGYGDALVQYVAALDAMGLDVSWRPVKSDSNTLIKKKVALADVPAQLCPRLGQLWNKRINTSALLLQVPPYRWHHQWADKAKDRKRFTYVAWEVDQLPGNWVGALNRYHKVFVPSQFNQDVLSGGGVSTPVEVVPHIARPINPGGPPIKLGNVSDDDYVFYTIGTWTSRKAMERTIGAYLEAFTAKDRVALVIKSEYFDQVSLNSPARRRETPDHTLTTAWSLARLLASYPNPPPVHLIPHRLTPEQLDQLHQRGDCFISLAHSEGWGLGAFEAALAGNPVVMTGWGGQLEYLGKNYPWLVDYDLTSTDQAPSDGYFHRAADVHWATARQAHAVERLRTVCAHADESRAFASDFGQKLQQKFSASAVAMQLARSMGLAGAAPRGKRNA